jgi:hypothetical protein
MKANESKRRLLQKKTDKKKVNPDGILERLSLPLNLSLASPAPSS